MAHHGVIQHDHAPAHVTPASDGCAVREPGVQRAPHEDLGDARAQRAEVGVGADRLSDHAADLVRVGLVEAAHGRGRRADADARGDRRRALVERHGVAVDGHEDVVQPLLHVLARERAVAQVELDEVRVGAARQQLAALLGDALGERRRVGLDRALVVAVGLGHRDREADGLGGRDVAERAALQAREDRAVDLLRELLAAEDEARARAGERLVRGRADDVGRLHGVLVQAGRDEAREVRHVDHQQRPGLVGDLAERARVDLARVGRAARHDQLRPVLERERAHLVEVDAAVLAAHRVAVELVVAAREVDLEAVREVAAVVEAQPEHRVARVEHGVVGRHVRAGARSAAARSRARRRRAALARSIASVSTSSTTSQPP